jgi:hypothetical protein
VNLTQAASIIDQMAFELQQDNDQYFGSRAMNKHVVTKTLLLSSDTSNTEIDARIEFTYSPGMLGLREPNTGIPLEPDSGPELDVCSVKVNGVEIITILSADFLDSIAEELLDAEFSN